MSMEKEKNKVKQYIKEKIESRKLKNKKIKRHCIVCQKA